MIVGGGGIIYLDTDPTTEGLTPNEVNSTNAEWAWDTVAFELYYWNRITNTWVAYDSDAANYREDKTGANVPVTLVDPNVPAIPIDGDSTIQEYDNGLVHSVRVAGAWVNMAVTTETVTTNAVAGQTPITNPPTLPREGDTFINTVDETSYTYDGTTWVQTGEANSSNFYQDNTGGDIPAVLVNPTNPATPVEGDQTVQEYDNGIVISTYSGGAWTNVEVNTGHDGETAFQDNTGGNIPGVLVDPTVIVTPIAGDAVVQQYDDGIVISTYNGTVWTNTQVISSSSMGYYQDNTGGDIPAVIVDPTTPATPINGDITTQEYDNGIVLSTYNGTTWDNVVVSTDHDGESISQDNTGGNIPATLVDPLPATIVTPIDGDLVIQRYDDGVVLSVRQAGAWVNIQVISKPVLVQYVDDVAAGIGGVAIGEDYVLAFANLYGLQQGMIKRRIA